MKKLLLLSLLFINCSTMPKYPVHTYECAIVQRCGVVANFSGDYQFQELAEADGEKLRLNLVEKKLIPENTAVLCHKKDE